MAGYRSLSFDRPQNPPLSFGSLLQNVDKYFKNALHIVYNNLNVSIASVAVVVVGYIVLGPDTKKKSRRKKGSCKGLQNLGLTCFLNAALQALAPCKPLTDWLRSHRNSSFLTQFSLTLDEINGRTASVSDEADPSKLLQVLYQKGWHIPREEQDCHEMLHVLLETVEEEATSNVHPFSPTQILTDGSFEESSENRVSSVEAEDVAAEAVEPQMLFHIDTIGSKPNTFLSDDRTDKYEVEDDGILLEPEGEEVEIIEIPDDVDQQDPLFDQVPVEIQEECRTMLMENEEDDLREGDVQAGKDSQQDEAEKLTEPMVIEADEQVERESQEAESKKLTGPMVTEVDEQVEKESQDDESEKLTGPMVTEVDGVVNLETSEQPSGKQKQQPYQLQLLRKESLLPAGVDQLLSNGKGDVYEFASDSEFSPVKKRAISKRVAELKGHQDNGVPDKSKSKRRASMGVEKKKEMAESDEEERKTRRRSMPLHKAATTPESRKTHSSASLATSHEVSFTGIKTKSPAQSPEVTTMRKSSRQRSVPSRLVEDIPVDSMNHEKQAGPLTSVTPKQPIVESPKIKKRKSVRVVASESMLKDDSKQVSSDPVTAQDTNEGLSEGQSESNQFELPMTPTRRSTRIRTNSEISTASNEANITAMISLATGISGRKSMPLAAMMEEGTNEGLSEGQSESNQFELPMTPTRRSTRIRTNSEISTASNEANITAMISGISRRKSMPLAAMMEEGTSNPSGVKASPGRATRKRRSMAPSVN